MNSFTITEFRTWDLNIYFREYIDETGCSQWEDTLTINPVVYVRNADGTKHIYIENYIGCTFAETRYIISERIDHGDDWFEDMNHFLETAPPRIASLLRALPDPYTVTEPS